MGMVVNGVWDADADNCIVKGSYRRANSTFGEAIPDEAIRDIEVAARRHVLIASLSCPWSHRVLLVRAIKSIEHLIPLHIAGGPRTEGYGLLPDGPLRLDGAPPRHVHQLYTHAVPAYTGRVTVPLIWDSADGVVVSNDSSEMMRGLDRIKGSGFTLVPPHLTEEIDTLNESIHSGLANAVYRAGLAQSQSAYDAAVADVFDTLEILERRLSKARFLHGSGLTETDLRLFATLVRFDAVYATHFRCTRYRLTDYPNLWAYARDLYLWPGVSQTVDFTAILEGYYLNDGSHNPHGIVAARPNADWSAPSNRSRLGAGHLWNENGKAIPAPLNDRQ